MESVPKVRAEIVSYFRDHFSKACFDRPTLDALLEKAKLAKEISDGKNKIPHKFLGRKI